MPAPDPRPPERRPPAGVPRWLWPPPGAEVERLGIRERIDPSGQGTYELASDGAVERKHLRALQWLLQEWPRGLPPGRGVPFEGRVVLEIARTAMPGGRVGFTYALNGAPLSDPGSDGPRGILWRFVHAQVSAVD